MQKMKQSPPAQIKYLLEEKELLQKTRAKAINKKIPVIDDGTGYLLSLICLLYEPESILEIGCGTGYSTYFLLKDLKYKFKYTGIDLNKERLEEAERLITNNLNPAIASKTRIKFIHGNALKIIPELNDKFDLVFIDAAKYEYGQYIASVTVKLKSGAIIIADNIFYKNKIFREKISKHDCNSVMGLRSYIEYIFCNNLFENHYYSIGDGLVLSFYKSRKK